MEIAFLFFIIFYNFKEAFFRPSQNPRRVFDFIALIRSTAMNQRILGETYKAALQNLKHFCDLLQSYYRSRDANEAHDKRQRIH